MGNRLQKSMWDILSEEMAGSQSDASVESESEEKPKETLSTMTMRHKRELKVRIVIHSLSFFH